MSDEELRRLLAEGTEVAPGERRLAEIRAVLSSHPRQVHALPSNAVMIAYSLAAFIFICLLAMIHNGRAGWHALSPLQAIVYFGAFLALAILFSIAIVEQLIPGARRHVRPAWLAAGLVVFLLALVPALFEHFGFERFVARGLPCLIFGTTCGAIGGVLGILLVRKGFLTSPIQASVLTGCFAGLAGTTALAIVCPQLNAPHILVWHFGSTAIGTGVGVLIGLVIEWRASRSEN